MTTTGNVKQMPIRHSLTIQGEIYGVHRAKHERPRVDLRLNGETISVPVDTAANLRVGQYATVTITVEDPEPLTWTQ